MKKLLLLISLFCFGFLASNAQTWTVTGNVTSSNTQLGVPSKTVYIMNADSISGNPYYSSTTTDASGNYTFAGLPSTTPNSPYMIYLSDCQNATSTGYASANNAVVNFSICTMTPPCQADFTTYLDSINANSVYFYDLSTGNPTSWYWDFSDGTSSTLQHPSHTYATAGTYAVLLQISGNNCNSVDTMFVTVGATTVGCNASFTYTVDINNPSKVQFNNNSTGVTSGTNFYWSFNDGTGTTSTLSNPSHIFPSGTGSYNVYLEMNTPGCADSTAQVVTLQASSPCTADMAIYQDSTNLLTYYFNDNSTGNPTTWYWEFGDGTTSTAQHATHTYATPGIYSVYHHISGGNCQSTFSTYDTLIVSTTTQTYGIQGTIYSGTTPITGGLAILHEAISGYFMGYAPVLPNGTYSYANLPAGIYKLAVLPDSIAPSAGAYALTYYGNVINWAASTNIMLYSDATGIDINLAAIVPMTGNGNASGNVSNTTKGAVSSAQAHLLNINNEVVATTSTDASGNYSFGNIANGDFKIWIEVPTYLTTPKQITISSTTQQSAGNNFLMSGNTITPIANGISNTELEMISKVWPNPVTNELNIQLSETTEGNVTIQIYSVSGQLIKSIDKTITKSSTLHIEMNDITRGSYILSIQSKDGNANRMLIQKI